MTEATPLAARMRNLASEGHKDAAELIEKADRFDAATAGYYSEPQTVDVKSFMGAYARARLCWCKASGEALV